METPDINKTVYTNNTYTSDNFGGVVGKITTSGEPWGDPDQFIRSDDIQAYADVAEQLKLREKKEMPNLNQRRIVKVFIVDPDDNVPLEAAILYEGEQKLTDLTDEELFFEVPIKDLLEGHNGNRVTVLDKKATNKIGKEIYLEPVRIRNLRMTVVDVAVF